MNRRAAAPAEPELPLNRPTCPRYVDPEPLDVYLAVLHLRRLGYRVLRDGRRRHAIYRLGWGLHLVKVLDDRRLIASALLTL